MADAQKVIELVFQGVDKTAAATQAALDNLGKVSGGLRDVTQPIADFTVGALKLEAGLLAAGVAVTAFAVKAAGDFDGAFREISTLLDKPVDDLGAFREAILDYAGASTAPLEQVTAAIYNAISAGVPLEKSLAAVASAEKLAVAGKADLNDTLRVLVSSLNAYGVGMDEAARFSDALFTTVRLGQTTLPELANTLARVTGTASALGVPFETVLAAISTLTAAGAPTEQAVTQINAALTALIKPTKEASDLAAELGIGFGAQAVQAKGLDGVLADVARATGGNQEQMAKLFGSVEALKAVFPLTGASAAKFASDLEAMRLSSGATDEAFAKMADGMAQSSQVVSNSLRVMFVGIGTPLLDEFGGMAQAIAGIFNAIGANVKTGQLGGLVAYVESIMGDLQATLEQVARNLPAALEKADLSGFKGGIDAVVQAFRTLFANIDLTTVDGLARAVELAGAAFLGLSKFVQGVIESFKPLFDLLVRVGGEVDNLSPDILQFAGNIAGFATQMNVLASGVSGLLPWLEALLGLLVVKQGVGLVGALAKAVPAAAGLTAALGPAGLVAAAGAAGYGVGTVLNNGIDRLVSKLTGSETTLGGWIYDLVNGGEAAEQMGGQVGQAAQRVELANDAARRAGEVWGGAAGGLVQGAQALEAAGDAAAGVVDPLRAANQAKLDAFAASEKAAGADRGMAEAALRVVDATQKIVPVFDAVTGEIVGYEQSLKAGASALDVMGGAAGKASGSLSGITEDTRRAEEAQRRWNEEVLKMQHAEKIKLIEQQTAVATARMEADARKVQAAYESINTTIESTGATLSSLGGTIAGLDQKSGSTYNLLTREMEKESKRRDDALKLQKELTEAQINEMRARAESMARGDALIQIDGAGLQPHLEAFMWEILKTIQVRVNQDGMEMLVGV